MLEFDKYQFVDGHDLGVISMKNVSWSMTSSMCMYTVSCFITVIV
jgi:hypothetical protein